MLYSAISRAMSNIFNLSSSIDEGKKQDLNTCVTEHIPPSLAFPWREDCCCTCRSYPEITRCTHTAKADDDVCAANGVEKKRRPDLYCRGWANVYRHGDGSQTD